MILRILIYFCLLTYSISGLAEAVQTDQVTTGSGVVIGSEPGLIYISNFEQKIIKIQTETGLIRVFAPSMGTAAVSNGEKISFAGHIEKIDGIDVINTTTGYIYRQTAKTMQEQMMEQMTQVMQMQQKQQKENSEPNLVSNAVPITMLETDTQKRDSQLNFMLATLGVLVALLGIERVPKLIHILLIPVKAIVNKFRRRNSSEL